MFGAGGIFFGGPPAPGDSKFYLQGAFDAEFLRPGVFQVIKAAYQVDSYDFENIADAHAGLHVRLLFEGVGDRRTVGSGRKPKQP